MLVTSTRLILIANYDTTSALAIASAGGFTGTLVGTVIPLLPPYLPVATLLFGFFQKWGLFWAGVIATAFVSPAYAPPIPALETTWQEINYLFGFVLDGNWPGLWNEAPLPVLTFGLGISIALVSFWGLAKRAYWDAAIARLFYGLIVAALLCPAPIFIEKVYRVPFDLNVLSEVMRRPWLPAEEISLKSGGSRLGYTLATKDGWFLILEESTRTVDYVPSVEVGGRRVCAVRSTESRLPAVPLRGATPPSPRLCETSP